MTDQPQPYGSFLDDPEAPATRPSAEPSPGPYRVGKRPYYIFVPDGDAIGRAILPRDGNTDVQEANARLMAASWDLLEAAKAVLATEDTLTFPGIEDEGPTWAAWQRLEAAVAKATQS